MSEELPPLKKVQIQTISTCNSNCVFCPYVESWHKANPGRMELKLFNKILDELQEFKTLDTISMYLQNEPLSDPRIFDWIKIAYEKLPNVTIEISCNPGFLVDKNVKKLIETLAGKKHILDISFHGMNQTSFEYIMQLPFKSSLENVVNLVKQGQGKLNLKIRGAGTSRDGRIRYFGPDDYVGFWYQVLRNNDIRPENVDIQAFTFHDRIGQIQRTERGANLNNYGIVRQIDSKHPFNCVRFDEVLHILWNGDIIACCMDYKKEISNLGNLNDMTIKEYYESEPYIKWYTQGTGLMDSPDNFMCKRCVSPGG